MEGKSLPLGGKVARNAPDEGETPGRHPLISRLRRQLPPQGEAFDAVYPVNSGCRYVAGGAMPRPYGVMNFVVAISRDGSVFPAGL